MERTHDGEVPAVERCDRVLLEALGEVFGLELEELPAEDGHGLWSQPVHAALSQRA